MPVSRIAEHGRIKCFSDLRQPNSAAMRQIFPLDRAQCQHSLAKRKCQPRTHFQNCEMIFHHLGESRWLLVIRGMSFINQSRMFWQGRRQRRCFLAVIIKDYVVTEFHTRLHHYANHSVPGRSYMLLGESGTEKFQGVVNLIRCCYCGWRSRKRFAAWGGNLGADYIEERARAWRQFLIGLL